MKREDLEKPVTLEDFDDAILRCQKSVGNMDLSKYERWIKEYGSYWSSDIKYNCDTWCVVVNLNKLGQVNLIYTKI